MCTRIGVLLAALAFALAGAGDGPLDRATLRGLTAVNVVIDPVAPELQKTGATAEGLRARLEEQLRKAGIKIDASSNVFAALRVMSAQGARGPLAIAVTLGLYQPITLVRDAAVKTATQTWEVETVVLADAKQANRACLDSVDELTGRFAAAYWSVNGTGGESH